MRTEINKNLHKYSTSIIIDAEMLPFESGRETVKGARRREKWRK